MWNEIWRIIYCPMEKTRETAMNLEERSLASFTNGNTSTSSIHSPHFKNFLRTWFIASPVHQSSFTLFRLKNFNVYTLSQRRVNSIVAELNWNCVFNFWTWVSKVVFTPLLEIDCNTITLSSLLRIFCEVEELKTSCFEDLHTIDLMWTCA